MEPGELIDQVRKSARAKKAKAPEAPKPTAPLALAPDPAPSSCLAPDRHPQLDFFIADIFDTALKDDLASMEHPLFALKAGDKRIRKYERNGNSVEVKPGPDGCATIHDKDVWIYCISQLIEGLNRGRLDIGRTVRFTAYNFLVTTNRPTAGVGYERMADAFARLSGTRIETNIATDNQRERRGFGLIDSWRVIECGPDNRMVAVEVTLPDWLWRSVKARHVLTLSRDYFRIRKPINRRIYELVRKHCGNQPCWRVSLCVLRDKTGSTASLNGFRRAVKALAASNDLPEYRTVFDEPTDSASFYARGAKGAQTQAADLLDGAKLPSRSA